MTNIDTAIKTINHIVGTLDHADPSGLRTNRAIMSAEGELRYTLKLLEHARVYQNELITFKLNHTKY